MKRRVVVTGIGAVTPIGHGKDAFFNGLKTGKNGASMIDAFDTTDYTTQVACQIRDFDPSEYINKKEAKRMDRFAHFAIAAAQMAHTDSKMDFEKTDMTRVGVIMGSGIGGIQTLEEQHKKLVAKGPKRVSPFLIPMMITNMASGMVSMDLGAQGPNTTVVTACASGTHAIGDAFKVIQRGDADVMFTGGAEASICELGMSGFCTMKAMSTRNDDPLTASRPFDEGRDGFVMGEGAGVLVLESLDHAKARGAEIYAEVVGYGATADAYHITSPAPGGEGAARCMKMAMNDAGIEPTAIDYINAHGTSTPYNDKFETMAIKSALGDHAYNINVSSTKSMTGHLLGASGAIEAIASVMAVHDDFVPPTINLHNQDPELDLNYTPNTGVEKVVNYALSNSLGFGGHNGTLIVRKFEE
ncbi:beta-ketoacyl-ACP synthase II [Acidaminobacter sp. JC074]|uniref:beta-ketoacyl-ACP synthase II n=1 Tax=Acidaminobacter sp. JC074 TaxID=2530199 RepID=UPI001F0EFA36|nr:beta-ketoacyl-ACP synthase II [Acidaminobacter sp. JC074]MCH4888340.1 beta-ketoacyl-ACP synthase II [Acidaminobacter sp. JC074]